MTKAKMRFVELYTEHVEAVQRRVAEQNPQGVRQVLEVWNADRNVSDLITDYIARLEAKWPADRENAPWADTPLINNAHGDFFYFGFATSMAQFAAPFAAALAESVGLVCFDPQVECLWDLQRCMAALLEPVGWRQATESLSPQELVDFAERAGERLCSSGSSPWQSSDGLRARWRLARPGAGGMIRIDWRQIGQSEPGAHFGAWLNIGNEFLERLLGRGPYLGIADRTWTWSTALDRSKDRGLDRFVLDRNDLDLLLEDFPSAAQEAADDIDAASISQGWLAWRARNVRLEFPRTVLLEAALGDHARALHALRAQIKRVVSPSATTPLHLRQAHSLVLLAEWVERGLEDEQGKAGEMPDLDWDDVLRPRPTRRAELPPLTVGQRARFGMPVQDD